MGDNSYIGRSVFYILLNNKFYIYDVLPFQAVLSRFEWLIPG